MTTAKKALVASFAIFAVTSFGQAQTVVTETRSETEIFQTNLGPGYSESINLATVKELDGAVQNGVEFEQPNNFMSDEGVYRYAYYEKTGVWLTLGEARVALRTESSVENI
ncbi:MAG: hypothetical protein WC314_05740 [Vulcanimicrobiota bacterium]